MGDALGIGDGIIRRAGSLGNAVQVAAADAVAALGVGAAVGDAAIANGATDCLLADTLLTSGVVNVDFFVELGSGCGHQLPHEGQTSRGGLFSAVLAERVGLALRFENEGSEPGREAVRQIEAGPQVGHATCRAAS